MNKYTINKAKAAAASRTPKGEESARIVVLRIADTVNAATEYKTAAEVAALIDLGRVDATEEVIAAIKDYAKVYRTANAGMMERDLAHLRYLINPESAEAKTAYETAAADWDLTLALRRADAERKLRDTVINGREAYVTAATAKANKAYTRKEEAVARLDKRAAAATATEQKAAA